MKKELIGPYTLLQSQLDECLQYIDKLANEKRYQAPPDTWNSMQVLYHLWQTESGVIAYLEKKMLAPVKDVRKKGIVTWVKFFFLRRAIQSRKNRFRAPSFLAPIPDRPIFEEVQKNFIDTRLRFERILSRFDTDMLTRGYFKHPIIGPITISQTLHFLNDHFERHMKQIKDRTK